MKVFESDLILTENTVFNESITVKGNIISKNGLWNIDAGNIDAWNIDAGNINAGNIDAWNINAWNINAWNINAGNIDAGNINAGNINAGNINAWNIDAGNIDAWNIDTRNIHAWNIICETRIIQNKNLKTICRIFITNKSKLPRKEQILKKLLEESKK